MHEPCSGCWVLFVFGCLGFCSYYVWCFQKSLGFSIVLFPVFFTGFSGVDSVLDVFLVSVHFFPDIVLAFSKKYIFLHLPIGIFFGPLFEKAPLEN